MWVWFSSLELQDWNVHGLCWQDGLMQDSKVPISPSLHMQCVFVSIIPDLHPTPFLPSPLVKVEHLEKKEGTHKYQPLGYSSCHLPLGGLLYLSFPSSRRKTAQKLEAPSQIWFFLSHKVVSALEWSVCFPIWGTFLFLPVVCFCAQGAFLEERCLWHSRSMGRDPSPCSQGSIWCWSTTLRLALPTPFRSGIN